MTSYVNDFELQAEIDREMPGAKILQRMTQSNVSDVFVNGGDYAPNQQRWVQIPTFSTAAAQAAIIKQLFQ